VDAVSLVTVQVDDGRKLIERLARDGFPVSAAGWLKEAEGGSWYLYLVSPAVDVDGIKKGYRRVHTAIRSMTPPFWIDPFDVKLVGPAESVGEAILDLQRRSGGTQAIRYGGANLGNIRIDEAYLYPPLTPAEGAEAGLAR
jgi:hypothetical protein